VFYLESGRWHEQSNPDAVSTNAKNISYVQNVKKINFKIKSFQDYYTHCNADFRLEVDQFPSESLSQRGDGVFGGTIHGEKFSWRYMAEDTKAQKLCIN
jgi:hypothetical protein